MELDRQPREPSDGVAVHFLPGRWGAFTLAAAGALLFAFIGGSLAVRRGAAQDPGWSARSSTGGYLVRAIDRNGPADGILQPGDRIVTVAGDRRSEIYGPFLALARLPAGSSYTVEWIRDGRPRSAVLQIEYVPAAAALRQFAPLLFIGLLLYGMAAWIALERPSDLTARLAAISFFLGAMVFTAPVLASYPGWNSWTAALALILASVWRPWHLAFAYDFISRFPTPVPEGRVLRMLRPMMYLAAAAYWLPFNAASLANVSGGSPAIGRALAPLLGHAGAFMTVFDSVGAAAMCLALVRNYIRLPGIAARRRIRWAGLGLACAIVPFSIEALVKLALNLAGNSGMPWFLDAIDRAGTLMVGLAPVMVGYAVVRHRVLGIHVVVRRGLQYLLARNVLRIVAFLPLLIVIFQAVRQADRSLADLVLRSSWSFYVAVAAAFGLSFRYRNQMRLWLDRKFFRVAYEREQILAELIEHVKSAESEEEVSLIVVREVERALSVDGIHVLLRDDAAGPVRVAFSYPPREGARIREFVNGGSWSFSDASAGALYEYGDAVGPQPPGRPERSREIQMFPLKGTEGGVTGYLALGPKRSEEPYTLRDRDLLQAIAGQMAVMYEILRLKERVSVEGKMRVQVLGRLQQDHIQLLNECPRCGRCYSTEEKTCGGDGAPLSLTLPVERVIEGKYRLDRRIGRGGMGVIYEARDLRLDRSIAVKMMMGELFGNHRALERFEREARTAAGLKHPNIVAIHDFGRLPAGGAYLVMELIRGQSWREVLRNRRAVPPDRAVSWFDQLCAATGAAHALGIVHRDLKPENVMIAPDEAAERVVVLDFGLAKVRVEKAGETELTVQGTVLGTRAYMSPEQRAGEPIDVRTDVYSIGVMVVETLTGIAPLRAGATLDWMRGALAAVAPPGSRLLTVLEQALAENPADRLLSARELGQELAQSIPAAGIAAPGTDREACDADTASID